MNYAHKNGMIYDPEDGQTIATMSDSATPEQAALLAAAPDLLQVLQDVLTIFAEEHPSSQCFDRARAAILKAGQEPTA
jgi:hypothetical protein